MFDSFQQMNPSEPDKYDYVDLRCRKQANMFITTEVMLNLKTME